MSATQLFPVLDPVRRPSSGRLKRVLGAAILILLIPVTCVWRLQHVIQQVADDPVATTNLAAVRRLGQPIIAALDRFHAEHAMYPTTLDELGLTSTPPGFLYYPGLSASIYKSPECAARGPAALRWADMMSIPSVRPQIRQFLAECVQGFRGFALQSADFPRPPNALERWAHYESTSGTWSLGWCNRTRASRTSRGSSLSVGGLCGWNHGATIDYTTR